jgi:hypothetical protein
MEETGLSAGAIEQLLLKLLYFRGELYGRELAGAAALPFSVIEGVVEALKLRHFVEIRRSLGLGNVSAVFAVTEAGRARARLSLESNQYAGPAPVPLSQFSDLIRRQRLHDGWLSPAALSQAYRHMVLPARLLGQLGPAVHSRQSLLLYGQPGDGKTYLAEALAHLSSEPVFLPYAIEFQNHVIQFYDPVYHQPIDPPESALALGEEPAFDRRWFRCRQPFVASGGELDLAMLDLSYNAVSKIYEAPLQLKAANGTYLLDDFGRQRVSPTRILNRWIVPMERQVDYLSFRTGGKMTVPFEAFLIFSTNLEPSQLGDEAFLRRIRYKLLVPPPSVEEFCDIFSAACAAHGLACPPAFVDHLMETYYRKSGRPLRRCHPRDLIAHVISRIRFENLPCDLTEDLLDQAVESCFGVSCAAPVTNFR